MKILFLEDRPDRQRQFLPNKSKDVETIKSYDFVIHPIGFECKKIIAEINSASYNIDDDVKVIFVHKSSLTTQGLNFLDHLCKSKKINLLCFSGGIGQVSYSKDGFEFLSLNSSEFYSNRLLSFLEKINKNDKPSILEIANSNWKLSYLFLAKQLINTLESEPDPDRQFNHGDKLNQIKAIIGLEEVTIDKLNELICTIIDQDEAITDLQ